MVVVELREREAVLDCCKSICLVGLRAWRVDLIVGWNHCGHCRLIIAMGQLGSHRRFVDG